MDETQQSESVQPGAVAAPTPEAAAPAEQTQAAESTLWDRLTAKPEPKADEPAEAHVEEAKAEPVAEAPKKPRVARKLADLAEREAAAAKIEADAKAHAQELAEARATLQGLKTDPLGTLEKAGLTYEQLTLEALKGKRVEKASPELEQVRAQLQAQIETMRNDYISGKVAEIKNSLTQFITDAGDKYELIQARGAIDAVWQTMVEISNQSGGAKIPTFDEAAEFVEKRLEEEANVYAKTKKFQAKVTPSPSAAVASAATTATSASAPAAKIAAKTALTNGLGAPVVTSAPQKPKTKDEAFKTFRNLVDKAFRGEGLR